MWFVFCPWSQGTLSETMRLWQRSLYNYTGEDISPMSIKSPSSVSIGAYFFLVGIHLATISTLPRANNITVSDIVTGENNKPKVCLLLPSRQSRHSIPSSCRPPEVRLSIWAVNTFFYYHYARTCDCIQLLLGPTSIILCAWVYSMQLL